MSDIEKLWEGALSDGVFRHTKGCAEELISQSVEVCINCGIKMIHETNGCFKCYQCGHSTCGDL